VEISVGHTPDSDDAFMFYGMLTGKVTSSDFKVKQVVEDIETLNKRALKHELDVTAVSVHACAQIQNYTILRSGGSFGKGYGPIVIAKNEMNLEELQKSKIAIPGKLTSAFLLLQLMIGKFDYVEMKFSDIPDAVKNNDVGAGLVIHETQITYDKENLTKILDVGSWWHDSTGGLPVPLGINVMSSKFENAIIKKFDNYLKDSIVYGLNHMEDAIEYAMQYSRNQPKSLIEEFVKMYVTDITVNMGVLGESAIRRLFEFGTKKGLISDFELRIL